MTVSSLSCLLSVHLSAPCKLCYLINSGGKPARNHSLSPLPPGKQGLGYILRIPSSKANPIFINPWERPCKEFYLQNCRKQPTTGWLIINQMDFILKQTFLFLPNRFLSWKATNSPESGRIHGLHYNSCVGTSKSIAFMTWLPIATQRLLIKRS